MNTYSPDYMALAHIALSAVLAAVSTLVAVTIMSRLDKSERSVSDKLLDEFGTLMVPFVMAVLAMIAIVLALESKNIVAMVIVHICSAASGLILFGISKLVHKASEAIDVVIERCESRG
jgi:formate hydrogenlyase subunit 3/multisubunit Na+/H+ antiporter MnhD subunit